ncbi:MAG: hypothetical protein RBR67_09970 [Desulfobacterium sp.]|nr:hypothetical protein [Desulfobacterium sp.]
MIKLKKICFKSTILILIVLVYASADAGAGQEIERYYIRYDIKSSNNRIVHSTILMVPGDTDFRAETYVILRIKGQTTAVPGNSTEQSLTRARENALKQLLEERGLKSVSTKSTVSATPAGQAATMDTVISYEGAFISPIEVVEQGYDFQTQSFTAVFLVRFSPVSFPDRWKWLRFKTRMKSFFQDVIPSL